MKNHPRWKRRDSTAGGPSCGMTKSGRFASRKSRRFAPLLGSKGLWEKPGDGDKRDYRGLLPDNPAFHR